MTAPESPAVIIVSSSPAKAGAAASAASAAKSATHASAARPKDESLEIFIRIVWKDGLSLLIVLTPKIFVRTRRCRGASTVVGEHAPRRQCGGGRGKYVGGKKDFERVPCACARERE